MYKTESNTGLEWHEAWVNDEWIFISQQTIPLIPKFGFAIYFSMVSWSFHKRKGKQIPPYRRCKVIHNRSVMLWSIQAKDMFEPAALMSSSQQNTGSFYVNHLSSGIT